MKHSSQAVYVGNEENLCDHLNSLRNLHGEIFHPHAKFQLAWIPFKITGFLW